MPPDQKQSAPLHVPQFTAANYGSFFLAGQHCTRLLFIEEPSNLIPKGHYVRRMFVSQSQKRQPIFMVFAFQKDNAWRHDPYACPFRTNLRHVPTLAPFLSYRCR